MKLKISYLILFTLIVNIFSANATIRFVSKTGLSIPPYTTIETAADSIQKAINVCVDGDTIIVANGVYKENLVINTAISLIGSSMDSTVIDGTGLGDYTVHFRNSGSIKNFSIYGRGEEILTSRVIYSNVLTNLVYVNDCKLTNAGVGIGMGGGDLIADNLIITGTTRGINLFGSNFNSVSNCIINTDNEGGQGINVGFAGSVEYKINNNIILFAGDRFTNPDYGITAQYPHHIEIYNNLISGFSNNIRITSPEDTVIVTNNVLCYNREGSYGSLNFLSGNGYIKNVVFSNNEIALNGANSQGYFVLSDYNTFWLNVINYNDAAQGDSDLVADPMFVKDTNPDSNFNFDYHLQAYSPAIDNGNPDILDLDGTRSDIGMYGGPFGETYTYKDLAPLAPRNLSALVDTNSIEVKWNRNTEADTAFYKVYRDTVINFTADSTKLISSQTENTFLHLPPYNSSKYVYKITCVDNQGNESKPSLELVVNITSVSTNDYPMTISDYVLYQNYPNPFNPSTKIGYQLKQRGNVKLMVYDIKGELISVLVNKEQTAGYYEAEFSSSSLNNPVSNIQNLASGIYLYRIEVIGEGNIPIYSDMKKMVLIK